MYLVRQTSQTYGVLGKIILIVGDGVKLKKPRPKLKEPCPEVEIFLSPYKGGI